jgi:hypothetical protein
MRITPQTWGGPLDGVSFKAGSNYHPTRRALPPPARPRPRPRTRRAAKRAGGARPLCEPKGRRATAATVVGGGHRCLFFAGSRASRILPKHQAPLACSAGSNARGAECPRVAALGVRVPRPTRGAHAKRPQLARSVQSCKRQRCRSRATGVSLMVMALSSVLPWTTTNRGHRSAETVARPRETDTRERRYLAPCRGRCRLRPGDDHAGRPLTAVERASGRPTEAVVRFARVAVLEQLQQPQGALATHPQCQESRALAAQVSRPASPA